MSHHTPSSSPAARYPGRREALRVLAATSAASLVAPGVWLPDESAVFAQAPGALPACVVAPQQTEGPYYVDTTLRRKDLRADPSTGAVVTGVPLTLAITVAHVEREQCRPLAGAIVDVWQCDAHGEYLGVVDPRQGLDTRSTRFLRGYQVTDRDGRVEFTTIYPGWYPGRTVHVHFKVRTTESAGRAGQFTSQWYFDDALTDEVFAAGPYAEKGVRPIRNDRDGIYRRGGRDLLLKVTKSASGYTGTFDLGVRMA